MNGEWSRRSGRASFRAGSVPPRAARILARADEGAAPFRNGGLLAVVSGTRKGKVFHEVGRFVPLVPLVPEE